MSPKIGIIGGYESSLWPKIRCTGLGRFRSVVDITDSDFRLQEYQVDCLLDLIVIYEFDCIQEDSIAVIDCNIGDWDSREQHIAVRIGIGLGWEAHLFQGVTAR